MEDQTSEIIVEKVPEVEPSSTDQLQQIISSAETVEVLTAPVQEVVEYAGFWVRFAAQVLDGLVLFIPIAIFDLIFGKYLGNYVRFPLVWVYSIYMLNTKQATIGKMALGLKVTTVDGGKLEVGKISLREIFGKFLSTITLGVGFFMIGFTEKKQGLHDLIAGTAVIYDNTRQKRKWLEVSVIGLLLLIMVGVIISDVMRFLINK